MKYISYYVKNKLGYEAFEYYELKMQVEDDAPVAEIFQQLKQEAEKLRTPNVDDLKHEIDRKQNKLRNLNYEIERATQRWNAMQEFLAAQGIKDMTKMPSFTNLLPQSVDAEIVEDDDGDDDEEDE